MSFVLKSLCTLKVGGLSLLCCVSMSSNIEAEEIDRVEAAFMKLDKDGNGFIDWEEFRHFKEELDALAPGGNFGAMTRTRKTWYGAW